MSKNAYPKYKPSGVEWLGDVPEHWNVKRLRFCITTNPVKSELRDIDGTTAVSFVPMDAVGEYGGMRLDQIKPIEEVSTGYTYFRDGDVVVAKITPCFENGKGAIASELENGIAFGTTELHVLRPSFNIDRRFLFYVTMSDAFRRIGASFMYGAGGQKRVPDEFIKDLRHPIPEIDLQRAIAAFLDRETGRIDGLIEKKKRQIELLREKRAALISHAVTKGLDPNAPLKDSGIEWLGQIPEHWDIKAIKFVLSMPITDGPHETPELYDDGIPFISAEAVKNDRLDFEKKRGFISIKDHVRFSCKYCPKRGDVYMVKSGATTGNVARVETDEIFNIWSPLAVLRPHPERMTTNLLFYFMKSKPFFTSVELSWSFGTQQNIGMGVISNLSIVVPPINEQHAIAAFLDRETGRVDGTIEKVQTSIDKLREYRTALISAAVTGKIDVRGEVAI